MTNKGKVLAAVVAVAVVLAGGVGLYLKGGDLMGRIGLKQSPARCPSESQTVFSYGDGAGFYEDVKYTSWVELYNGMRADLDANGGKTNCAYRFTLFSEVDVVDREDSVVCANASGGILSVENKAGFKSFLCLHEFEGGKTLIRIDVDEVGESPLSMNVYYEYPANGGDVAVRERVQGKGVTIETVPWKFF